MRVTARWSGFSGAPGFTVMHFRDFDTEGDVTQAQADSAVNRVGGFFNAISTALPSAVTVSISGDVEILEDSTGTLVDSVTAAGIPLPVQGGATGNVAGPAGAVVNWRTGSIRNGRRIRGRTFLVPLATSVYAEDGTLSPGVQSTIQTAATALVASTGTPDLGVYARPSGPAAADGQWVVATGANVPDMVAVLRSRRD